MHFFRFHTTTTLFCSIQPLFYHYSTTILPLFYHKSANTTHLQSAVAVGRTLSSHTLLLYYSILHYILLYYSIFLF
jgi:hypothetical protein